MRKFFLLCSAVLLTAGGVFAQASKTNSKNASHISLGPVVSLGHSWVGNLPGDMALKFSPAAGIGLVYSRHEHLGFGAQLLVSHEGYKQELMVTSYSNPMGQEEEITINPVYIRLPLHVIYFFGDYGDRVRPKIYAGPSFAARVDEKRDYSSSEFEPVLGNEATDQFSNFDAGLSMGLGANVRLSKITWLNLDAGYYHGLVDVINQTTANDGFNANRNLRLNIGLMWGL